MPGRPRQAGAARPQVSLCSVVAASACARGARVGREDERRPRSCGIPARQRRGGGTGGRAERGATLCPWWWPGGGGGARNGAKP